MGPAVLFLDVETSGLDPLRHGIIQIAWILEDSEGNIRNERCFDLMLHEKDDINPKALQVSGFTYDRIMLGSSLFRAILHLRDDITACPARPCGHNIPFDISFLFQALYKTNEKLWYLDFKRPIDTRLMAALLDYQGKLSLEDYRLVTVADHFNISFKAHDALEDVRATRAIFHEMMKLFKTL